ncbi:tRNA lysidine(34) synthetase TilS [Reyranella sp.]|uniref:tRNA lysidine(34) synthetase TilS n=1 Tax=Reyranella sp. TaxID=1929291 RepID=UPI003784A526
MSTPAPAILDADGFVRLMAPFAPFESCPELVVAVSGGRDSMALALLAHEWAHARGGRVVALTVDHGLRPESGAEAATTLQRLAGQGVDGVVLRWSDAKPGAGLQEAARAARYRLLRAECRRRGILHLLVAHHADDQAETVIMRAARDSGADGLAGMAAQVEFPELRLLRPLLPVPRARLTATLLARGVQWIDDPSNADPRFERVRVRLSGSSPASLGRCPVLRGGGVMSQGPGACRPFMIMSRRDVSGPEASDPSAAVRRRHLPSEAGEDRTSRERQLARAAVATVEFDEAGLPAIDQLAFDRLAVALRARLLSRLVQRVGGRDHPPRRDRLERAAERLIAPVGRGKSGRGQDFTLSQCRLMLRQAPGSRRLRWLARAENGGIAAQPLVPAAFFACGAAANNHLE